MTDAGHLVTRGDAARVPLPDACADLVFADPPFNIGYGYDVYRDARAADDYLAWCRDWGAEAARVLKPDGTLWVAIGDEFAAELKVLFHRTLGLHLRSWVVWTYGFGVNCVNKFTRSHVHLFYFTKDPARFTFNPAAVKVPSARQVVYGDKRAKPGGRLPDDTWILRPQDVPGGFDPGGDTWPVPRVCGTFKERQGGHPCQMPERVLARVVAACSDPGGLVVDPFVGSGTTPAVARKLGRRAVALDLSPAYAAAAAARVAAVAPGDPVPGEDYYAARPGRPAAAAGG